MRKLSFIPMNLQLFAEDGGASGGVAAPQETQSTEVTQSTGESTGGETGTEGTEGTSVVADPASQPRQSPEQDRAFAQMRREAEQAKREAEQAKRDQSIAKKYGKDYGVFSEADISSVYGSQGIHNLAELETAIQRQEYQAKGIDPDLINQIINEHPDVKKAREYAKAQEAEQGQQALNSDLKELSDEYPDLNVKKAEDVFKLPNADKIYEYAMKGYSLLDAYEKANRAEIKKRQAEASRQATLNSVTGKEHLRPNGNSSDVDTTVIPDDVLDLYKKFNPGKTMEEYKAHWKASH